MIDYEGKLWQCLSAVHKTPGNKRGFVQARMRSLKDGNQKEFRFSSTEILERISLRERSMQYLYREADLFHFMDVENYEQIQMSGEMLGEAAPYLMPDAQIKITFFEDNPVGVNLPSTMEFQVIEAEPGLKTATASASPKNAKIETGLTVRVPQFINVGDRIKIDTSTGEYLERVSK